MVSYKINYLEPDTIKFCKGPGDVLQLKVGDKDIYPQVRIFQSYPLSKKNILISVRDATDEDLPEIGLIKDLNQLSPQVQELIKEKLQERYFVPVITKIVSLKEKGEILHWEVETDKGLRKFVVHSPYEHIRSMRNGKLLVIDIHNCRYEIPNYDVLTEKIKDLLSKHIYI